MFICCGIELEKQSEAVLGKPRSKNGEECGAANAAARKRDVRRVHPRDCEEEGLHHDCADSVGGGHRAGGR